MAATRVRSRTIIVPRRGWTRPCGEHGHCSVTNGGCSVDATRKRSSALVETVFCGSVGAILRSIRGWIDRGDMGRVAGLAGGSACAAVLMVFFGAGTAVAATPGSMVPVTSVHMPASPGADGGAGSDGSTSGTGSSGSACARMPSPLDRLCLGATTGDAAGTSSSGAASSGTGAGAASTGAGSGAADTGGASGGTAAPVPSGTAGTTPPAGSAPAGGGGLISTILMYIAGCLQALGL
jgi:hypothetical protein